MHTKLINARKNVTVHGWIGIGRQCTRSKIIHGKGRQMCALIPSEARPLLGLDRGLYGFFASF